MLSWADFACGSGGDRRDFANGLVYELKALEYPAMTQRSLLVSPMVEAARVVAGKTKNESLANSESTGGICRFGAIIVGRSGGAAELNRRGIKSATGGQGLQKPSLVSESG
jgi:hypothetical protein